MPNSKQIEYQGLPAVEVLTAKLRLVVVTGLGPRIAHLGKPDGENLLLWEPNNEDYGYRQWRLRGGHRVWVTRPMADECEDTYATDNQPCEVDILDDGVRVVGAQNQTNLTRRGMTIRVLAEDRLEVDNFVINDSEMLYSGGLWALTCTLPGQGRYAVPIGDGSDWDTFHMVSFRKWGDHGQAGFGDPQFRVTDELFLIEPAGKENKRMVQSHHGVMAMSDPSRGVTFAKKVAHDVNARYPMNTNMAFYVGPDNFMVEMESMGPEVSIKPGGCLHHTEQWLLRDEAVSLDDGAGPILALFE
jgi:hypothetical protein